MVKPTLSVSLYVHYGMFHYDNCPVGRDTRTEYRLGQLLVLTIELTTQKPPFPAD